MQDRLKQCDSIFTRTNSLVQNYLSIKIFLLANELLLLLGENVTKAVLNAIFLGQAFAEALHERIGFAVGEISR